VAWTVGGEEMLVLALERGELDLALPVEIGPR
jgi:hypothetical protein